MNKYLLAGCAAAALTLGSGIAAAQDFKVTLSGEAKFSALASSQDRDENSRNVDFRNRFRFTVNPEATAFNGALTYGARVMVKNEDSDGKASFEANYIYASGAFGKVYLGGLAPFNDDNGNVTRPNDWISENDGFVGYMGASKASVWTNGTLEAFRSQTIALGDQATKVRYDTPFIYGLKLGVSYTPSSDGSSDAWSWDRARRSTTVRVQDAFEIGLLFDSTDKSVADKFGSAVLKASVGYQGAKNADTTREKFSEYQAGLQVGYAGFTVGGSYVSKGKSDLYKADLSKTDDVAYGVGAQYVTGPWKVGLGYFYEEKDATVATDTVATSAIAGKKKFDAFSVGAMYNVAKGLDVGLNYTYAQAKNTRADNRASDTASIFGADVVLGF